MIYEDIYKDILNSFGVLWKFKERDKSLEIITPFATTSQKFVSIFLTERDGEFIISDGGWVSEGAYDNSFDIEISCYSKIFTFYKDAFNIKEVNNLNGSIVFYKKTNKKTAVPSLTFDMANFISTMVSLTNVDYSDQEKENEHNFTKKARTYLENIKLKKNWDEWNFNEFLDSKKQVKPSATLRKKNSKIVIVNFITGSQYQYFKSGISKTLMVFELADISNESVFIENKIALLDNKAKGYDPNHFSVWLGHLVSKPKASKIEWTRKKELEKI
jgi:hypothetical protein